MQRPQLIYKAKVNNIKLISLQKDFLSRFANQTISNSVFHLLFCAISTISSLPTVGSDLHDVG